MTKATSPPRDFSNDLLAQLRCARLRARFLPRRSAAIRIIRGADGWMVLAGAHGWIHGDAESARRDAQWLSKNLSLPVREATS